NSCITGFSYKQYWRLSQDLIDGSNVEPEMVFDAGSKKIKTYSEFYERNINQAAFDFFGNCDRVNEYWAETATIGSDLQLSESLVVADCLTVSNWINIVNGYIAAGSANRYAGVVGHLVGDDYNISKIMVENAFNRQLTLIDFCGDEI